MGFLGVLETKQWPPKPPVRYAHGGECSDDILQDLPLARRHDAYIRPEMAGRQGVGPHHSTYRRIGGQTGPDWLESHIVNLGLRLADVQPARTTFPAFVSNTEGDIQLVDPASSVVLAQCSLEEPELTTVWLPMSPSTAWEVVSKVSDDLLQAGYPGCLGCGGPHTEGDWDEATSRRNMLNEGHGSS